VKGGAHELTPAAMADPATVDMFFGWANSRFGLDLPRLAAVCWDAALVALWNRTLIDPPHEDAPLPPTVGISGSWQTLGFTLNELTVHFNQ